MYKTCTPVHVYLDSVSLSNVYYNTYCIHFALLTRLFMVVIPMHGTWVQMAPLSLSSTEPSSSGTRPPPASSSRMEQMSTVPPDRAVHRGRAGGSRGHQLRASLLPHCTWPVRGACRRLCSAWLTIMLMSILR